MTCEPEDPLLFPHLNVSRNVAFAPRSSRAAAAHWLAEVDAGDPGGALDQGAERDLQAGADRAAEILAVGGDGVDVDPGAEVDHHAGLAEALVGGDRVDQAVGADLERVVDPDRHPALHAGADGQALGLEVALGHPLELAAERRHHRGDDDRVDVAEVHLAEVEEAGDPLAQLVAGRAGAGLEAPVLDQLLAFEGAEVSLRVSDVDSEQHARRIAS